MSATPPRWAEGLLRVFLKPGDSDSVSGDLLEQVPTAFSRSWGGGGADWWYMTQVFGFVWRDAHLWAVLFGAAVVARTAMDWVAPPSDFQTRSAV